MISIHEHIKTVAVDFEIKTGKKPTNVYLGKYEMKALKRWAFENGYTVSTEADVRGDNRPEVGGLLIFEVNEFTHTACA